jgi:carbonic anhydrase/acetyltransferase-like protein (isoleucine patch superfamily)
LAVYALDDAIPDIHPEAYIQPDATVIGQVSVGAGSTVCAGAVLRGDYGRIMVGDRTSHAWAVVAAGPLVGNGVRVPARALATGVPARIRQNAVAPGDFDDAVARYVANGKRYSAELRRVH